VTRRALNDAEYRIFRFHYLLGADWKMCCRRLEMDRGSFFHEIYRLEQRLGRIFADLEPFPLYPLDEYFSRPQPGSRVLPSTPPVWGERSALHSLVA